MKSDYYKDLLAQISLLMLTMSAKALSGVLVAHRTSSLHLQPLVNTSRMKGMFALRHKLQFIFFLKLNMADWTAPIHFREDSCNDCLIRA